MQRKMRRERELVGGMWKGEWERGVGEGGKGRDDRGLMVNGREEDEKKER